MLAWRLVSAAVGLPLLLLVTAAGGPIYDAVLALVLASAVTEFLLVTRLSARSVAPWLAAVASGAFALVAPHGLGWSATVLSLFVVLVLGCIAAGRLSGDVATAWFLAVVITLYVGWLGQYLALVRHLPHGKSWAFLALAATFASDTGAYVVGRLFGRRPLAPRVSPAKTVEGAVGGLVCCALVVALLNLALGPRHAVPLMVLVGLGLSVAAQAGDLAESALKRALAVKDAGRLIPGHGGLLDRLDSLLAVGVVVYFLVQWAGL